MENNKQMDIHITLGNQNGLQDLTDVNVNITSNPNLVQKFVDQSKVKEAVGNDLVFAFHFYVQNGKEKQVAAYFQDALKPNRYEENLSPIQMAFQRPQQSEGTVQVIETPGCIVVKYVVFAHSALDEQELDQFNEQFSKYQKATITSSVSLKGSLRHTNNNRTNVKVDYVDVKIQSQEMTPKDFSHILKYMGDNQQQLDFLNQVPALQMIGNLKRAQFQMKLASFRQIKGYYNKACGQKFQKQEKPFKYINRGLFRKQVSFYGFFQNNISVKVDATYNGEDALMRLVKVFFAFITKL